MSNEMFVSAHCALTEIVSCSLFEFFANFIPAVSINVNRFYQKFEEKLSKIQLKIFLSQIR